MGGPSGQRRAECNVEFGSAWVRYEIGDGGVFSGWGKWLRVGAGLESSRFPS
jgi:hypothetical protein